jgi:hypothetical protein
MSLNNKANCVTEHITSVTLSKKSHNELASDCTGEEALQRQYAI